MSTSKSHQADRYSITPQGLIALLEAQLEDARAQLARTQALLKPNDQDEVTRPSTLRVTRFGEDYGTHFPDTKTSFGVWVSDKGIEFDEMAFSRHPRAESEGVLINLLGLIHEAIAKLFATTPPQAAEQPAPQTQPKDDTQAAPLDDEQAAPVDFEEVVAYARYRAEVSAKMKAAGIKAHMEYGDGLPPIPSAPIQEPPATIPNPMPPAPERIPFYEMLEDDNYIILDTETTGLGADAEIVEIAIVDSNARILLDTRVKPNRPIPPEATRIHGISDADVASAPTFADLYPRIVSLLAGRNVVVYNSAFDMKMLIQSARTSGLQPTDWKDISTWYCAMMQFATVFGAWNDYHQTYKWQPLTKAVGYFGATPGHAHSALGDCVMTAYVCQQMLAHYLTYSSSEGK